MTPIRICHENGSNVNQDFLPQVPWVSNKQVQQIIRIYRRIRYSSTVNLEKIKRKGKSVKISSIRPDTATKPRIENSPIGHLGFKSRFSLFFSEISGLQKPIQITLSSSPSSTSSFISIHTFNFDFDFDFEIFF